jgi:hypothetical protein
MAVPAGDRSKRGTKVTSCKRGVRKEEQEMKVSATRNELVVIAVVLMILMVLAGLPALWGGEVLWIERTFRNVKPVGSLSPLWKPSVPTSSKIAWDSHAYHDRRPESTVDSQFWIAHRITFVKK